MIVVMPAGHVCGSGPMFAGIGATAATDKFTDDFLKDAVPYVEKTLRLRATQPMRALAGLSMGGIQTLNIGLTNHDKFSHLGVFSSGWVPQDLPEVEKQNQQVLDSPETKKRLKLLWVGVGTEDGLAHSNTKNMLEMFKRHGIDYVYKESGGGHDWNNWRTYLSEFAPLLFR